MREQRRDIGNRHGVRPSLQIDAGLKMPPVPYKTQVNVFAYSVRENMGG